MSALHSAPCCTLPFKTTFKTNVVDPDETAFFHPPLTLMFTSDINEMADKTDFKTPAETATEIVFLKGMFGLDL